MGEQDDDLIQFTGASFGLSYDKRLGIVMNITRFGEYLDPNGNIVTRQNCGANPDKG